MNVRKPRIYVGFALAMALLFGGSTFTATPAHANGNATLEFVASPYADFLFYLLHRDNANFPDLRASVPIDEVAKLNTGSFLPAYAMASDVSSYADLYQLAYTYADSAVLINALKQGEPHFASFMSYWQQHVKPKEQATIATWTSQESSQHNVERLQQLARMRFPYASVKVAVVALGPLGPNIENPPIMFATAKEANLSAVVGYEGMHMMMSGRNADWRKRHNAPQAIAAISARGGSSYDIEEALCLLMQSKLPQAQGEGGDVSAADAGDTPRRVLLRAMEKGWDGYRANTSMNAADFAIAVTLQTFGPDATTDAQSRSPESPTAR